MLPDRDVRPESKRRCLSDTSQFGQAGKSSQSSEDGSLLTKDDFKDYPVDQTCCPLHALLKVAEVASLKLSKNENIRRRHQPLFQARPDPPPDLPEEFKKKIEEMDGSNITLLIQKSLYSTDLRKRQNRFSLPLKQIKNPHFLRKKESQKLMENQALDIILIEPSLHTRNIKLGKWNYTTSSSYVLKSCWMDVVNANGLKVNDVVQVWSFRVRKQLRMALVKLSPSN